MCKEYKCYTKEKNDALYICKILFFFFFFAVEKVPI